MNLLCDKAGQNARYGKDEFANQLGYRISAQLAEFVESTPVKYGWKQRAMLHAQSGISSDIGTTPGARLPYGDEPDPITHLQTVAPHHAFYHAGSATFSRWMKPSRAILRRWCSCASAHLKPGCVSLPPT